MKVRLSPSAARDLAEIGDRIAQDDPRRAVSFVEELAAACMGLAEFPKAYPTLVDRPDIRRRNHGRYAILYRLAEDQIFILRILHGARDIAALLTFE